MAEWNPGYVSEKGIFTGSVPKGSIQRFLDASSGITGGLQSRFELLEQNTPDWYWTDAYGVRGGKIIELAKNDTASNTILFEIPVKNPDGATYWKQTIVFYISYYSDYTAGAGYDQWHDHISLGGISRYEYATPYASPTVTSIISASPGIDPWWNEGDLSAVPRQWDLQLARFFVGIGNGFVNDDEYFGVYLYDEQYRITTANRQRAQYASLAVPVSTLAQLFGGEFEPEEKDDPNDDPDNPPDEEEGGNGNHRKPDYPIPKPGLPTISAAAAGFLTLYKLTPAEMSVFADDCLASDVWEAIKLLLANPLDFIVGCSIVPFVPPGNTVWKPKFGAITFTHAYSRIDNQYVSINCGNLYIEPFGKNFLDYAPFTRLTLYLPYIGFRELDVNEVMGKTINVEYYCDCLSGDCIAFIYLSDDGATGPQIGKVLATYNGNCACQVPFASQSFNSLISSSVNMLTNVASSVVKGDIPTISGSGIVGALEGIGGDVQKSGSIGSSNGYMGVQYPYLIKHIPKDSIPSAFRALKGYPSNISGALGSFSGYAEIDNIDLTNISSGGGIVATSAELEEIQTLLRGGVFI